MKLALVIEYSGTHFYGWQAQKNLLTIQGVLEDALSQIANESIVLFCAGRTDAGVHAKGQVVHFETQSIRPLEAWTRGTNSSLPPSIAVRFAQEVDETFHARFSAISRRYRYVIYNHPIRSALNSFKTMWYRYPLNIQAMQQSVGFLIGEKDFSSFRSSQCESKTPMRNVSEIQIFRQDSFVIIEIEANAFLHHMVRNIVGALLQIGSGKKESFWMQELLMAKDRRLGAETAPPEGLYLIQVNYPEKYHFSKYSTFFLL